MVGIDLLRFISVFAKFIVSIFLNSKTINYVNFLKFYSILNNPGLLLISNKLSFS
jgi:hypothetical protein